MGRPLRIEYEGACYHVMNRGNRGQEVFLTAADRRFFVARLGHFAEMFRVQVRAYCLMPNHFHLYVCTLEANLSRFVQSLLTSHAVAFNLRHGLTGHVFQGRFHAVLVEDDVYGAEVGRYVHLNPVRVASAAEATVGAKRRAAREFRWGSYGELLGLRRCPRWLDRDGALGQWGPRLREQRRAYAEFVEEGLLRDIPNPLDAAAAQAILGTEPFVDRVRRGLTDALETLRTGGECGQAAALGAWLSLESLVDLVAAAYNVGPSSLLRRHSRGNEARQVLLYLASRYCRGRHSLAELAQRLGPITTGALARARELMAERVARNGALRRRVSRIERTIHAQS